MNCGGRRFRRGPQDEGLCQKMCMVCMCGICGESAGGDGDVKVNWVTEVEADAVSEN